MATERITEGLNTDKASKLITALNLGLSQTESAIELPSGQYGFKATIETDKTKLTNDVLDFEYDIPFDDDIIPNESEITIYNLSDATINNFKKGNELTITAGYNTDVGIILRGKISKVTTKHEDCDKITTVRVLDNFDYKDGTTVEKTYETNTTASYILKDLLGMVGLPIEVFTVKRDHTYTSATTVKGSLTENIKTYSSVCGVSTWVNKRRIFCRPPGEGDNIHFTVCAATGMIGSPEPFEESNTYEEYKDNITGYNINMLAQHRMTTAAIVDVDSRDYKGSYRVQSGSHTYDGLSAVTKIKCVESITTEIVQQDTKSSSSAGGGVIDQAVNWALQIASDDSHKYSQSTRWGPNYDCSSFVISAYQQAGVNVKNSGASYTGNMYPAFTVCGFKDVTSSCNLSSGAGLKKGDVLLNKQNHAALVQKDGGVTVEARGTSYGIVSGVAYRNYPWDCVLRKA